MAREYVFGDVCAPLLYGKLACREEKRWRQALRCERFDVTLFQDKLRLSITHEQVQGFCVRLALQDQTRAGDKRGGMWILKGEAGGVAACEGCGGGGSL